MSFGALLTKMTRKFSRMRRKIWDCHWSGTVCAALPLVNNGSIIEDIRFTVREGRIVEAKASRGEDVLNAAIAVDDGARYFGEVALVPYDSPIRSSGLLFYNTLYDENASCHLAFGEAYRPLHHRHDARRPRAAGVPQRKFCPVRAQIQRKRRRTR